MSKSTDTYRIDCPSGHEVSVPHNLLGQDLVCPTCNTPFKADVNESAEEHEARIEKAARQWLIVAVSAASLLVLTGLMAVFLGLLR